MMVLLVVLYIISSFISIITTGFLHIGNLINIMCGTYLLIILFLFILKKLNIKKIFGNFRINKEVFFWSINYLVMNLFISYLFIQISGRNVLEMNYNSEYMGVITLIIISLIAPILEEIFYRGVISNILLSKYSVLLTGLLTGIIFTFNHGTKGILMILTGQAFYYSYIYLKTKSLTNSIIVHIINNSVISLIVYYSQKTECIDCFNGIDISSFLANAVIIYIVGGVSTILCGYNYYRMYRDLKKIK